MDSPQQHDGRRQKTATGYNGEETLRKPQGGRTTTTTTTTKPSNKKKRTSTSLDEGVPTKKQKHAQPLKGMILSVSTLKDGIVTSSKNSTTSTRDDNNDDDDAVRPESSTSSGGYQDVCQMCHELGAQVTNQVSKRVHMLLCTTSAVEKSTQRVRKAFKRKIPIVDVAWLEACQTKGRLVDMKPFCLDMQAKAAIDIREKNLDDDGEPHVEASTNPNAGWTEGVSFGCSCICHENGSEKDCPWCSKGCTR